MQPYGPQEPSASIRDKRVIVINCAMGAISYIEFIGVIGAIRTIESIGAIEAIGTIG